MDVLSHTFPKAERLCGRKDISNLLDKGSFCDAPGRIRCCFLKGTGSGLNRMMVSVPKKLFKRAVKRNLLKRRIRESYRLQKHSLNEKDTDLLIVYGNKEILGFKEIYDSVAIIIDKINANGHREN